MPTGTIIKGIGGFYYVKTGERILVCKARGLFRKHGLIPLVGDTVDVSIDPKDNTGFINNIHKRFSQLDRPAVSNVTQLIAVIAVKTPEPDLLLLDKLLVIAGLKNLKTAVCINKTDLGTGEECRLLADEYKMAGFPVAATSCSDNTGFEKLEELLKGEVSVFAGQSGVGKSTILNTLLKSRVMDTGEISGRIGRGKHTTRHAQLVQLQYGGFVVDTPGFSSFEMPFLEPGDLQRHYPEFQAYADMCRYKGCLHVSEPDCAVKEAIKEGKVSEGRHKRYAELVRLLKEKADNRYR